MIKKARSTVLIGLFYLANALASPAHDAVSFYLNNPTEENAAQAASVAAERGSSVELGALDLLLIRNQIVSGSAASLRLVLTLRLRADGGALEDLDALAAASIRPQPLLFLRMAVQEKLGDQALAAILLTPGLEYVDRPVAREHELAMRERAIASVSDRRLAGIRDRCLKILKARSHL